MIDRYTASTPHVHTASRAMETLVVRSNPSSAGSIQMAGFQPLLIVRWITLPSLGTVGL